MKSIKTIQGKIHIVEDFISPDTANFISSAISKFVIPAPDKSVFAGPSCSNRADLIGPIKTITEYNDDPDYNVAIDLISNLSYSMAKTISDFYSEDYVLKTIFYNKMISGAKNTLHMDNNYIEEGSHKIKFREGSAKDKSGLLYLNCDCDGGVLSFPLQEFSVKPKPGTFIFFEGNKETPHEVLEITGGERHNLVSFFWPKELSNNEELAKAAHNPMPEVQATIGIIKNDIR